MAKKKTVVAFQGTAEQEKQLLELIEKYKDVPGSLMSVLQHAQVIYGYLPIEVQKIIAKGLNVTLAEVYGVVTFYAQFTLNPKGEHRVSVCMGTACYVKGARDIMDRVSKILNIEDGGITPDGKFSLDATRCIGACGLAPVMTINEDVHGRLVLDDVDGILKRYM